MKKFICLFAVLFAFLGIVNAQVKQEGKVFVQQKTERKVKVEEKVQTDYTYKDTKGVEYPIYINKKSGACYIEKTSQKTGNMYRQYMEVEVSQAIAREYGIEYTPKKKIEQKG